MRTLRALSLVTLSAALAFGLVAWPARAFFGAAGPGAAALGVGIAWVGAVLGLVPLLGMARGADADERRGIAFLAASGVRLFVTLGGALAVLLGSDVPTAPFATGITAGYFALLATEVFVVLRESGQNPGPLEAGDAGAEGAVDANPDRGPPTR